MSIKALLAITTVAEATFGFGLIIYPSRVVRLLFGADIAGVSNGLSRIAGISLIALGLACWPTWSSSNVSGAFWAMFGYSLMATLYLAYLGTRGEWVGPLLWPAVVVHAVITLLFLRAWFRTGPKRLH